MGWYFVCILLQTNKPNGNCVITSYSIHYTKLYECTVYGQPDKLPVTEATPRKDAESPYGNTKRISEDIIKDSVAAYQGINAIALRYFNPIGAHPTAIIGSYNFV